MMGKRVKRAGYPMPRADRHMCEERQRAARSARNSCWVAPKRSLKASEKLPWRAKPSRAAISAMLRSVSPRSSQARSMRRVRAYSCGVMPSACLNSLVSLLALMQAMRHSSLEGTARSRCSRMWARVRLSALRSAARMALAAPRALASDQSSSIAAASVTFAS